MYNSGIHNRHSIRLKEFDYSQNGYYFVTICIKDRECLFGDVVNGKMVLSEIGKIVEVEWIKTGKIRKNVQLDEYVIMPNHFHGIIIIENDFIVCNRNESCRGAPRHAPTNKMSQITPKPESLPIIINHFKSSVKRWCNKNGYEHFQWQRNYYEHVIRNEIELNTIREYILNNPMQWEIDDENPKKSHHRHLQLIY